MKRKIGDIVTHINTYGIIVSIWESFNSYKYVVKFEKFDLTHLYLIVYESEL